MNKQNHVLLEKARRYVKKKKEEKLYKEYWYNQIEGYWTSIKGGAALMQSVLSVKPMTKKEDIETGEDRKGE